MPRPLPVPVRRQIVARHRAGQSLGAIAAALGVSPWTVRTIWRRWRDGGEAGLRPSYGRCGPPGARTDARIVRAACWLRRRHPRWGARLILAILAERYPGVALPHPRTVERWFRARNLRPPAPPPPPPRPPRAGRPHAVWQVDAKEQVRLADGSRISWLTIADEASGAIIAARVFPLARWEQVAPQAVRSALEAVFAREGLPERLRLDNGAPWGAVHDLPPALALWVIGLGVEVHWNHPRRCEENGVVERGHGVLARWVEPDTAPDAAAVQARLGAAAAIQRAHLRGTPAADRRRRSAGALRAGGRPYAAGPPRRGWDVRRVWRWLAAHPRTRRVDKVGRISVYGRKLGVGRAAAGQTVTLGFDPVRRAWTVHDEAGSLLARHPAPELTRDRLLALDVAAPTPARRRAQLAAADRGG